MKLFANDRIKKGKYLYKLLFLILLSTFALPALGQNNGKISGLVVDADFGEPLVGVNVIIQNTLLGAATSLDGKFTILQLPPGNYTLEVSMIGYAKQIIEGVSVKSNETTHVEVILKPELLETEEVVVVAKAVMNTEASLLSKRQKSIEVSDAISSEQFEKTGSSNAADAVKQIVGATVVNGKDVFVRGLGDKYTSTNLNGAQIPSADPYKRSGSIDIIPSNLIDNIQVVKSFTPDKPGDFSGGAVNVKTKDFPDRLDISFSSSAKYNSQVTFNDNGLGYYGSHTDWLGFDDGTRALPPEIGSDTWTANVGAGQRDDHLAQKIDEVTKSFNPQMTPFRSAAPINQSYALSIGNQYELFGKQVGLIGSLTYKNQHSGYIEGQLNRWDRGVADPGKTQLDTNFAMSDTRSVSEVVLGGLFKASMNFDQANTVSFNFLYNRNAESTARFVNGKYPYDIDASWNYHARTLLYKERNLRSYQLEGNHCFESIGGVKINWLASSMNLNQYEPDNRFFYNYKTDDGIYGVKTNLPPERYFRRVDESQDRLNMNFVFPIPSWNKRKARIKVGGAYSMTNRTFNERRFVYNPVTSIGQYLRAENGNVDALFSEKYLGWTSQDTLNNGMQLNRFGLYINETDQTSSNYRGTNGILAYYGMIDLPISGSLRVIAGARYETTDMKVVSAKETIDDAVINTNDILPSLSIIFNPIRNMNFRTSYGRTLARPSFREISRFQNYEFNGGDTYVGNPDLKRTLIDNIDLRWEWFTNPGEVLSVSLFAKKFTNPIEMKIIDAPNKVLSWTNVDKAEVYGLEFEIRKRLGFLSTSSSNFQVGGNLSLIYSKVDIDSDELENIRIYEPEASSTRKLQGQSPYIVNFYLNYENSELGFTSSIYYNVYGKRLSSVGSLGTPDVYETPINLLNLTATKTLSSNLMLKIKAENLLNAANEKIQEFKGNTYIYSRYLRGLGLTVGLTYKI